MNVAIELGRHGDWIQTYTGRQYWPNDPRPEDVDIVDIAHALSMECRYGGHCSEFYSVAEHCLHISNLFEDPEQALWGLLDDAHEAYCKDMPRPSKRGLPDFQEMERKNKVAVARRFGIPEMTPHVIKMVDNGMLFVEQAKLLRPVPPEWGWGAGVPHDDLTGRVSIWCMPPKMAEAFFLRRFNELWYLARGGSPL